VWIVGIRDVNCWVVIYRLAWGVLIVLFVVGVVCVFVPKCQAIRELQYRKAALQEENRRTEARTREFMAKQERFTSDTDFLERTARQAGLVKTNETVFRFSDK
jgi:cell division protein FtsB